MGYRVYNSVKLRDGWPNTFCRGCGEPIIIDDSWRDVRIGWTEVLRIGIELWGLPLGFFNRDFLIVVEFERVMLVFCGQGPQRGTVEVSVPVGDEEADGLLKGFLERVREVIEGQRTGDEGRIDEEYLAEDEDYCPECGGELGGPDICGACGWLLDFYEEG